MKSLQESLFDTDLADKDVSRFGDHFAINNKSYVVSSREPLWNQFSERRLKKDLNILGTGEGNETIITAVLKLIKNIPLAGDLSVSWLTDAINDAITPYVGYRYRGRKDNVIVRDLLQGRIKDNTNILTLKEMWINIIGLRLAFDRK